MKHAARTLLLSAEGSTAVAPAEVGLVTPARPEWAISPSPGAGLIQLQLIRAAQTSPAPKQVSTCSNLAPRNIIRRGWRATVPTYMTGLMPHGAPPTWQCRRGWRTVGPLRARPDGSSD